MLKFKRTNSRDSNFIELVRMLDEELKNEMKAFLPEGVQSCFISSVAQQGLTQLKDLIWEKLNK